ncbi:MAG: hypothetical protein ABR571_11755 [Jatrophihabitans sp.]|uniref:hypothetical protein n=1 Tax=Jatrophihabitans sp. TaxID=1932789 RepID=UPI0039125890
MSDPNDEKAPMQVGPDTPDDGKSTDERASTDELPQAEAVEAEKSDDVDGPEDFGPITEYGDD